MLDVSGTASSVHYSITARPNSSLSPAGTLCVFLSISLLTLAVAIGFLLIGAWLVLPFAGIELSVLYFCFHHVWLHAQDFEKLTIDEDRVVVETHRPGFDSHEELSGYWIKVMLDVLPDGYCRRMVLRSHGKEIEFGRLMSSEQRLDIGHQLQCRLGGFMSCAGRLP